MNSHPRLRKYALRGGLAATIALAAAFALSYFWVVAWRTKKYAGYVSGGQVGVGRLSPSFGIPETVQFRRKAPYDPSSLRWFEYVEDFSGAGVSVALWVPALVTTCITLAACRATVVSRRRARGGYCPDCNYNRAGLAPTAVCPECGAAPIAASAKP